MSTERAHHDYSPSTLQSLEACPCYQSRQSKTPHPRTVIGTLAHDAAETGEDNAVLSDDDSAHVADCIDFFEGRKQAMEERRARLVHDVFLRSYSHIIPDAGLLLAEGEVPTITEIKEIYLKVDEERFSDILRGPYGDGVTPRVVESTTAGYIDSALISHDETYAEIFDWKFGRWPVEEASNNLQGIGYALGMFRHYPKLQSLTYHFKQPLLDYVTSATLSRADIPEKYLRVQVVVARAREARRAGDFATAKAHVPACNFCAHIGRCPVVGAVACKVGSKFFPVEIPPDITPSKVYDAHDTKLGLVLSEVLAVWSKAFRGVVADRAIRGDAPVPDGYSIASRTPREIVDPAKYKAVALSFLTLPEYETTLKPSFGKVENLISAKAPRGKKKAEVERFGVELAACGAVQDGDGYVFLQAKPKKPGTV